MRILTNLLCVILLAGCSTGVKSGELMCGVGASCPSGDYCASDDHCWKYGTGPAVTSIGTDTDAGLAPSDGDATITTSGEWTWLGGAQQSSTAARPVYGQKGVAATANVPGARDATGSARDSAGNFFMYGGYGYPASGAATQLNELWKFDGTNWAWLSGNNGTTATYGMQTVPATTNVPPVRAHPAVWIDTSDALWVFGGEAASYGVGSDLWRYANGMWTWMAGPNVDSTAAVAGTKGTPSVSNVPAARSYALTWRDSQNRFWLFGGQDSMQKPFNDLWRFDPATVQWTWISGVTTTGGAAVYGQQKFAASTNTPGARKAPAGWIDAANNLWLFGGSNGNAFYNDVWKFDGANWTWLAGPNVSNAAPSYGTLQVAAASNLPPARQEAMTFVTADGTFWLFGGDAAPTGGDEFFGDLWKFDGTNWSWWSGAANPGANADYGSLNVASALSQPGARRMSAEWLDAQGRLYVFGGSNTTVVGDFWRFAP